MLMQAATQDFLAQKRIAVVGVSRDGKHAANLIYRKLRSEGYRVYAVNPQAQTLEGDLAYPDLKSLPETPDGVVIVTRPQVGEQVVQQCAELGIKRVWMHNGMHSLGSSVSPQALEFCRANGITAIPGGCPMMYIQNADFGHRFMRWMQNLSGGLPKQI
ncbi:MAG: CoA-binding protein [Thermaceae bacterium]|nr:CoA-binding protein [Thermaceae bacterium]